MTTTPPPSQPVTGGTAYQPSPVDPYPNKAITVFVTTIVGILIQWLTTGALSLAQEGATALIGAVATILVYVISNFKRRGF